MNHIRSIIASLLICSVAFAVAPALRAETPPDQIQAAGAIPLTTALLDKMDAVIKALVADPAAKAELNAMPTPNPADKGDAAGMAEAISSKCPKAMEHFKSASITPDEFTKAIFAIMACAFSDDMAKSSDKTAAANATFITANKDKCDAVFGGFMQLSMPPESAPSP